MNGSLSRSRPDGGGIVSPRPEPAPEVLTLRCGINDGARCWLMDYGKAPSLASHIRALFDTVVLPTAYAPPITGEEVAAALAGNFPGFQIVVER